MKSDDREADPVLRHLQRENTLAAIVYGIQAGQLAIAEVLNGGPAVLGPKRKTEPHVTAAHDNKTR